MSKLKSSLERIMTKKYSIQNNWFNSYYFLLRMGAFCAGVLSALSFLVAAVSIMLLLASIMIGPAASSLASVSFATAGVAITSGCAFGLLTYGLFQAAKQGFDDITTYLPNLSPG
jgi:hypothetical protein